MGVLNASFLNPVHTISCVAGLAVLTVSAGTDLKARRIPNELVAAVAAIGLVQGLALRPGWVWLSLLVAAIVFCGLGIFSHHRVIGGGDVKLISAVTLLVPPERVGHLLIAIALAGGAVSCCYLAARYVLRRSAPKPQGAADVARRDGGFAVTIEVERVRIAAGDPMPYALAVLGGVIVYITGQFVQCYAISCS